MVKGSKPQETSTTTHISMRDLVVYTVKDFIAEEPSGPHFKCFQCSWFVVLKNAEDAVFCSWFQNVWHGLKWVWKINMFLFVIFKRFMRVLLKSGSVNAWCWAVILLPSDFVILLLISVIVKSQMWFRVKKFWQPVLQKACFLCVVLH